MTTAVRESWPRVVAGAAAVALAAVHGAWPVQPDARLVLGGMLLGFWALCAWSVGARVAARLEPQGRGATAVLRTALFAYAGVLLLMAAAGAVGAIRVLPITVASALAWIAAGSARGAGAGLDLVPLARAARARPLAALVILSFVAFVALDVGWAAVGSVTATDDLGYHLAAPVEWVQSGRLRYQFLPFGNHSPPYYPMLTELAFAWAYLPLGELAATKLVQGPLLGLCALAVYCLLRELGGSARASAIGACFAAAHPTALWYLGTNHVDVVFAGLFVASLLFLVRLRREPNGARAFDLCLVLGIFLGTKVLAVLMGALVLAPIALILLLPVRRELLAGARRGLALGLAAFVATGGWWYVRNVWWSGNPLFPLLVEVGGIRIFDGAYDRSDLPGSSAAAIVRIFTAGEERGALLWLLPVAPLAVGLVAALARARAKLAWRCIAVGLVVPAWIALVYLAFCPWPYTRFLLAMPFFASALLVPALDGGRVGARIAELAVLASFAAAIFLPAGDRDVILPRAFPGLRIAPLVVAGTALGAAAALAWGSCALLRMRARTRTALVASALAATLALLLVLRRTSDPAGPYVVDATRALWMPYVLLEQREPRGARVAQTGSRLVLAAQGWRGRNRVQYVHIDDGPPSFHERVRALAARRDELRGDRTGFGYYRARPDEASWRRNLARFGAEYLVATRLPEWIAERPSYFRTPAGFPIEVAWADAAPQDFELVHAEAQVRIYALRSAQHAPPMAR